MATTSSAAAGQDKIAIEVLARRAIESLTDEEGDGREEVEDENVYSIGYL